MLSTGDVSWSSKKEQIVTLSTTESEYIASASGACHVIWLKRIPEMLHQLHQEPTMSYCDNSYTIELCKNPILHGKNKHIDVRYHFL